MRQRIFIKSALIIAVFVTTAISIAAQTRKTATANSTKTTPSRSIIIVTEPKAFVWLDEVRRGTTDANGSLTIAKVASGKRSLRVRAVGFTEKTQTILLTDKGEIKVSLTETTDEAELAFQQAEVLRESGLSANKPKAIELYKKAFELRPNFPQARVGLARALETTDVDEALAQIAAARKLRPNYAEASTVEGRIFRENSDAANGVKSFKRAIREANNFQPEAHTGLALAYEELENFTGAITEFKIALSQLADTEPVLYQLLGDVYAKANNKKEAIASYEKFLTLAPQNRLASAVRSIIEQLKTGSDSGFVDLMPQ